MLNKFSNAVLVKELLFLSVSLITYRNSKALIQEGLLTQTRGQNIKVKIDIRKNLRIGFEANFGPGTIGVTQNHESRGRIATRKSLSVFLTVSIYFQNELFAQSVDNAYAYAVQTTGNFVGILVKLAASMQDAHNDFTGRATRLMQVYGNSASIIRH